MARLGSTLVPPNMQRAAIEKFRTLRAWRAHLATHAVPVVCACDLQPGRFRKSQRVGGCGRPHCWLCHSGKLSGELTVKDRRAFAVMSEGLAEIGETNSRSNGRAASGRPFSGIALARRSPQR